MTQLTFRTPRMAMQGFFQGHFSHAPPPSNSGMLSAHERSYTKGRHPGSVVWVSCYRLSKHTKSNICPL